MFFFITFLFTRKERLIFVSTRANTSHNFRQLFVMMAYTGVIFLLRVPVFFCSSARVCSFPDSLTKPRSHEMRRHLFFKCSLIIPFLISVAFLFRDYVSSVGNFHRCSGRSITARLSLNQVNTPSFTGGCAGLDPLPSLNWFFWVFFLRLLCSSSCCCCCCCCGSLKRSRFFSLFLNAVVFQHGHRGGGNIARGRRAASLVSYSLLLYACVWSTYACLMLFYLRRWITH